MKATHHLKKTCAARSSNRSLLLRPLVSLYQFPRFSFHPAFSLSLCVRISLSLRFISLCHRSCSRGALSSITLCITDDALATACFNAAGLLFVDSTDSTIHGGKGATGKATPCSKFNNITIKKLFSISTLAMYTC